MSRAPVSGPALRDRPPDADDWGTVVRPLGPVPIVDAVLQRQFDIFISSPTLIYVGYAALGATILDAAWRIKRITFALGNPTELQWSGESFTAVWNDRNLIPYS